MKRLAMCRGALLVLSLAVVSASALAGDSGRGGYRSEQSRDIDHSQVAETQSVAPSRRVIETNHLIVQENETRNVGTVQHNHTIIEQELVLTKRNVDHKYVNTVVDLVQHKYSTVRKRVVEVREIPGEVRDLRECHCERRPLRAYGRTPRYVTSRD
jgi:hypothetical protein